MKRILFGMLLCVVAFSTACNKDKDPSPCEQLEGDWVCQSWREDGVEYLGSNSVISFSDIDFGALIGDEGDFDWQIRYNDGSTETITGDYEVNNNCTEVTLQSNGGGSIKFDFKFDRDELILEGNLDGFFVELTFERD